MDNFLKNGAGILIFAILILLIIFLILREFNCWYWKVNKRVQTLESIDQRLADIQRLLIQGNNTNAVITGEISNIASDINSNKVLQQTANDDENLPEL